MKKTIPFLKCTILFLCLCGTATFAHAQTNVVTAIDNEAQIRAAETRKFYSLLAATPQAPDKVMDAEKYKQYKQYFAERNIREAMGNKYLGLIKIFYNTNISLSDRLFVANLLLKHYTLDAKEFPSSILYADKQALILNQK
jgi:hypothetical protein